jgi:hypothetical protein
MEGLYPTEFLNTLKFAGIPDHELRLKIGLPVMLLRNINVTPPTTTTRLGGVTTL